jgi:hypothetical protein
MVQHLSAYEANPMKKHSVIQHDISCEQARMFSLDGGTKVLLWGEDGSFHCKLKDTPMGLMWWHPSHRPPQYGPVWMPAFNCVTLFLFALLPPVCGMTCYNTHSHMITCNQLYLAEVL